MTRTDPLSLALEAAPPGSVALVGRSALARILLAEAALGGGGVVVTLADGATALVGVAAGTAARVAAQMAAALDEAPRRIPLPEGAALLREAPPDPLPLAPRPRLRPLRDAAGVARAQLLSPGPGPREEATRALLRQVLSGAITLHPGLRLFLECPMDAPVAAIGHDGGPEHPRAPVAVLPLPAVTDRARLAALRSAGWASGLLGADAAALDWMKDPALWALAPPTPRAPAFLPPRLVLLGPRPAWAPPEALHEGAP